MASAFRFVISRLDKAEVISCSVSSLTRCTPHYHPARRGFRRSALGDPVFRVGKPSPSETKSLQRRRSVPRGPVGTSLTEWRDPLQLQQPPRGRNRASPVTQPFGRAMYLGAVKLLHRAFLAGPPGPPAALLLAAHRLGASALARSRSCLPAQRTCGQIRTASFLDTTRSPSGTLLPSYRFPHPPSRPLSPPAASLAQSLFVCCLNLLRWPPSVLCQMHFLILSSWCTTVLPPGRAPQWPSWCTRCKEQEQRRLPKSSLWFKFPKTPPPLDH